MFPREIRTTYLDKKDYQKSRSVQNLKEVIIDLKCLSLFQNFIKEAQWLLVSEEVKSAENVKDQEMREVNYINVQLVVDQEKWKE